MTPVVPVERKSKLDTKPKVGSVLKVEMVLNTSTKRSGVGTYNMFFHFHRIPGLGLLDRILNIYPIYTRITTTHLTFSTFTSSCKLSPLLQIFRVCAVVLT